MSGDSLSVLLFLWGTAITCGVTALTVAGWRRAVLIGLTAITALVSFAAMFIGPTILGGVVLTNAKSPVSWFVLIVIVVAFLAWPGRANVGSAPNAARTKADGLGAKPAAQRSARTQDDVQRAARMASFTAKVDVENKISAIDKIRAFRTKEVLRVDREANALRPFLSQKNPDPGRAADVGQLKENVVRLYQGVRDLREAYKHYPALEFLLSAPPSKTELFEEAELLAQALSAGAGDLLIHHHQNKVYGWLQQWNDWWNGIDGALIGIRTTLSGN